jgi:hypothetical protein
MWVPGDSPTAPDIEVFNEYDKVGSAISSLHQPFLN